MAVISGFIPNFLNGVSQQSLSLRTSSQGSEQINGISTTIDGLKKRPASRHIAPLMTPPAGSLFTHLINRDTTERYEVIISNGDLKVFDLNGNAKTVAFPNGKAYLNHGDPFNGFSATTIQDYTFITNKYVKTALDGTTSPANVQTYGCLINVKQGVYGKVYNVLVNGTLGGQFQCPSGGAAIDSAGTDTTYITTQLVNDFTTRGVITAANGWTVVQNGNSIYIGRTSSDFTISVTDGFGGANMIVAKNTIQRFVDLPTKGPAGFITQVTGDETTRFDNYWIILSAEGTWKETVQPGIPWSFDAATMPHILVREADGSFTFKRATWSKRLAGDTKTNPTPSFLGHEITDIFFTRNRLGFTSVENVVLSQIGNFFNFWRQTVTSLLDDDLIDVNAASTKAASLYHAVPLREAIVLFADQTQFSLRGSQNVLTPKSVYVTPATDLPCSIYTRPVTAGDKIYFLTDRDTVRVYEYSVNPDTYQLSAAEITGHVPGYIPAGAVRASASSKHNMLALTTSAAPDRIYCYQWVDGGQQRLQSAWHYWTFAGANIVSADFVDSDLVLVIQREGYLWMEKINIDAALPDTGLNHWLHLDRRLTTAQLGLGTYNATNDTTTYNLPYFATLDTAGVAAPGNVSVPAGVRFDQASYSGTTVTLKGNSTGLNIFVGNRYTFSYTPSPIAVKRQTQGGGEQPIANVRLQLRYINLVTGQYTADLFTTITPQSRPAYSRLVTGYALGRTLTDGPPLPQDAAISRIPVMSRADTTTITFTSDSPLPCSLISAQWEGQVHAKASTSQ